MRFYFNCLDDNNALNFMNFVNVDASDETAVMIVAAEAPPLATKSPTKERVERNHDDNDGKKRGAANEDDLGNLEDDDFQKFMSIIKLDASNNPAVMIVAAEEPPVATKSPTKKRVERDVDNEGKKRGANEDDLGIGLVDCAAPAERKVPAASYESAYETPSNKEESDQDMAKSSDTIIGPAEKVCSEVIGGGEQPAKSNDVELHEWDLPGERRSSSVRELKSNLMMNSINTLVSNFALYIVV